MVIKVKSLRKNRVMKVGTPFFRFPSRLLAYLRCRARRLLVVVSAATCKTYVSSPKSGDEHPGYGSIVPSSGSAKTESRVPSPAFRVHS